MKIDRIVALRPCPADCPQKTKKGTFEFRLFPEGIGKNQTGAGFRNEICADLLEKQQNRGAVLIMTHKKNRKPTPRRTDFFLKSAPLLTVYFRNIKAGKISLRFIVGFSLFCKGPRRVFV